jgi:hypothetical protein
MIGSYASARAKQRGNDSANCDHRQRHGTQLIEVGKKVGKPVIVDEREEVPFGN